MSFYAAKTLAFCRGKSAERNALIHFDVISDYSGFADDDSRAMVDEKSFADFRAGVNVDAGFVVRPFGHNSRNQRHIFQI